MYEVTLPNGNVEVHTTTTEFKELYKTHTAKEMSKIFNIPFSTVNLYLQKLGLKKSKFKTTH